MEQQTEKSLFDLSVDTVSRNHLAETTRWARFLAITGIVFCGLFLLTALTFIGNPDQGGSLSSGRYGSSSEEESRMLGVVYLIMAVLYFFPCLFCLRFANKTRQALQVNDQLVFNEGLKNLKVTFRYMGVVTIIGLAFILIAILLAISNGL